MAYNRYLLKIKGVGSGAYSSDYTFPLEYIQFGTFKPIRAIQDKNSYRDGDGVLHRNVIPAKIAKVEFQLRENIRASEYDAIMSEIRGRYTLSEERKCKADFFLPEICTYTGSIDVYMPDPDVTIKRVDDDDLVYVSVRMAFIGYGDSNI